MADASGRIESACNLDAPLVPASIVKILTALAAIHILGLDYRFGTTFFTDADNNLYIRGAGDPLLISEEVALILTALKKRNVNKINDIYIDNSLFALENQVPGRGQSDNPFDSPVVATGVNFNTVNIRVDTAGKVVSNEPQTPTLPIMHEMGKSLQPGTYRLNICQAGCMENERTARYTAELFRGIQERIGMAGGGTYGLRSVPAGAKQVYRHENSQNLAQVVASFLEYSNNTLANQVFLACGAMKYGYPATWQKGRNAVMETLSEILGPETATNIIIEEGSGLSRNNRVSAAAMIRALIAFSTSKELLPIKNGQRIKSGTLDGVYNFAGYLDRDKPFVIMINQKKNTRDRVLQRLMKQQVSKDERTPGSDTYKVGREAE